MVELKSQQEELLGHVIRDDGRPLRKTIEQWFERNWRERLPKERTDVMTLGLN